MFYRLWDLVYSKAFRIVAGALVVVAAVGGIVLLAWRLQPDSARELTAAEQTAETAFATACQRTIDDLETAIDSAPRLRTLNVSAQERFVLAYATASRTCTYAEFIEFDLQRVTPFVDGASLLLRIEPQRTEIREDENGGGR